MAFKTILLYIAVVAIAVLFAYLAHYHAIYAEVRRTSRCLRLKDAHELGGTYTVKAVNDQGKPLYTATYDLEAKQNKIECACAKGAVINHFSDVPYFDLKAQTARKLDEKLCNCDSAYDGTGQDVFFEGAPGLVRFMQDADTSFFQSEPTYHVLNLPSTRMGVTAVAGSGSEAKDLYSVHYDVDAMLKGASTFHELTCACPPGAVANAFSVPVYEKDGKKNKNLTCQCDATYAAAAKTYRGTPGLVTFMSPPTHDAGVFTDILGPPSSS